MGAWAGNGKVINSSQARLFARLLFGRAGSCVAEREWTSTASPSPRTKASICDCIVAVDGASSGTVQTGARAARPGKTGEACFADDRDRTGRHCYDVDDPGNGPGGLDIGGAVWGDRCPGAGGTLKRRKGHFGQAYVDAVPGFSCDF